MFVCVFPLSRPSSRDLLDVKCLRGLYPSCRPSSRDLLDVKCLRGLYPSCRPSSGDLDYPLWDVHVLQIKMNKKDKIRKRYLPCNQWKPEIILFHVFLVVEKDTNTQRGGVKNSDEQHHFT